MGEAVARVARCLAEAKETKELDMSNCLLNQIPDATYLMMRNHTLEKCNLSQNLIKRIPSKFPNKFPLLKELNVQGNQLASLPEEFGRLEELQVVDISDNRFETLPSWIYDCSKLKVLCARKNKIEDVDVGRLQKMLSLTEVDLQDNCLSASVEEQLKKIDVFTVHIGRSDPLGDELDEVE